MKEIFGPRLKDCQYKQKDDYTEIIARVTEVYEEDLKRLEELKNVLTKWYVFVYGDNLIVSIDAKDGRASVRYIVRKNVNLHPIVVRVLQEYLHYLKTKGDIYDYEVYKDLIEITKSYDVPVNELNLVDKYKNVQNLVEELLDYVQYVKDHDVRVRAGILVYDIFGKYDSLDVKVDPYEIKITTRATPYEELDKVRVFHERMLEELARLKENQIDEIRVVLRIPLPTKRVPMEEWLSGKEVDIDEINLRTIIEVVLGYSTKDVKLIQEEVKVILTNYRREDYSTEDDPENALIRDLNVKIVWNRYGKDIEYKDVKDIIKQLLEWSHKNVLYALKNTH